LPGCDLDAISAAERHPGMGYRRDEVAAVAQAVRTVRRAADDLDVLRFGQLDDVLLGTRLRRLLSDGRNHGTVARERQDILHAQERPLNVEDLSATGVLDRQRFPNAQEPAVDV